jgi:O-antigen/teichoic acid export membrane protein
MDFLKLQLSKLKSGVAALQFFQVLRYGALILIGILLSKSSITTADIGVYETLLFLAGTISYFWVTGVINTMLMGFAEHTEKLFVNVFILLSIFSLISFLLLNICRGFIIEKLGLSDTYLYSIFSWYVLLNTPCFLIEYIYLLKKQSKQIVIYGIATFVMNIILVALPVFCGFAIAYAIYGLVLVSIIKFIWLLVLILQSSKASDIDTGLIKKYLYLSYPLIIAALLGGASEYTDGLIVTGLFNKASFAIYRYGAKEFPLALLLANAMSNALVPIIADSNKFEETLGVIKEMSTRLMHLLFPISIIMMICSHWLFANVFNSAFIAGADIFNVYLLILSSRLVFPQTILLGLKKTKVLLFTSIAELVINIVLSILLAYKFGIIGVAFGTLIACMFEKAVYLIYNKLVLKIDASCYINKKILSVYSIILIGLYFLCFRG